MTAPHTPSSAKTPSTGAHPHDFQHRRHDLRRRHGSPGLRAEPGFSRDVAIIGAVSNELWCGVEAQQDLAKSAPFRHLAEGEFIKIMCVRKV
jgi:hypothetical protein